jgi:putative hydroxymethylpyrimidine transport system substrate-binding protein
MTGGRTRRGAAPGWPALLALLLALLLAGCGDSGASTGSGGPATLVLDFRPNAVHAGIEVALAHDFDGAEGVDLRVRSPASSADAVKLLVAGRAQFAVLDIHDLALARSHGHDVVGVMPIVQRPLASLIARPGIRRPRQLQGRRVGTTGVPSDDAVLEAIVDGDGGNGRDLARVSIGFNAVAAVLSGRVDAATAFWNVEGVALRRRRPRARVFHVEDYGAPAYPELVVATMRQTLDDRPGLVRDTVRALRRGYEEALADPAFAESALVDAGAGDRGDVARQLDAVQDVFVADAPRFGVFSRPVLERWARWEAARGLVDQPPDVARAFAFGL